MPPKTKNLDQWDAILREENQEMTHDNVAQRLMDSSRSIDLEMAKEHIRQIKEKPTALTGGDVGQKDSSIVEVAADDVHRNAVAVPLGDEKPH